MNKTKLQECVNSGMTLNEIKSKFNCSQSTIRYWLKKFDLSTKNVAKPRPTIYKCKCGETDPKKFYGNKKRTCGNCHKIYTNQKSLENRQFAIDELGGKCLRCGYEEFNAGLNLHHLNPKEKDPKFYGMRFWSKERIKSETKKCVLLCANCHNSLHAKNWEIDEIL